jgi:hypothetical protein
VRRFPLVVAAYNDEMVDHLLGSLRPLLRPGDGVDLVSGNRDHAVSITGLNRWVDALSGSVPGTVRLSAHTSSLGKVDQILAEGSPRLTSVFLDYEPQWDPEFSWEFGKTLAHFDAFAARCRAEGRRSVAYPTGRPLQEPPLRRYRWDYGEMRGHVDEVVPQTQHWATLGSGPWLGALRALRGQWVARGILPASATVQLTLGNRNNGLRREEAILRMREAVREGFGRLFLWWQPDLVEEVRLFLEDMDALTV